MADHIIVQEWEWDVYSVKIFFNKNTEKNGYKKKNIYIYIYIYIYMGKRGSHTGVEIYIWCGLMVIAPQ